MTRHRHADLIHAWAEGAEIEHNYDFGDAWQSIRSPQWLVEYNYRIKPTPKPDVVWFGHIYQCNIGLEFWRRQQQVMSDNLRLTFSGETGELIKAEVLK